MDGAHVYLRKWKEIDHVTLVCLFLSVDKYSTVLISMLMFFMITDMGQGTYMYYVYADFTRITEGTTDIICALQDLMCTYYVHNYKYLKTTSKFLELVQQYFLKIIPATGSKSNAYKVGNQQRIVQRTIESLSNHDDK